MNIYGVVVIDLDLLAVWEPGGVPRAAIPPGVRVRVDLGDRWGVSMEECRSVARRVYGAASVEVVGNDPRPIRDMVDYLRSDERTAVA
ncbi:MAG: hypothetical protein ACR2FG_09995 [Marmoricola sp.]